MNNNEAAKQLVATVMPLIEQLLTRHVLGIVEDFVELRRTNKRLNENIDKLLAERLGIRLMGEEETNESCKSD